ncbi:nucleotide-binding domain-containing protein [Aeromonas sp. 603079]|uniref:nucleotide-binding domain-containing protein n=1 Tax=Aeromonas sp. 603079 TaxID=2712045 RepID=UPI003B9EC7D7
MNKEEMFNTLLDNLKIDLKQAKKISFHYRKITRALNKKFRSSNSAISNRLKVGSVGRHTAIKGISDLDMLYIMPGWMYVDYNKMDNGQSKLLTDVRNVLAEIYPEQEVKKDRLVVQISFKNFQVEVQPVFKQPNGDFIYPESYYGGSWKTTKPSAEISAMKEFSRTRNDNLRKLCKMVRAWKNRNGVNMGGLLIDTLVHRFLSSTDQYDSVSTSSFDCLSRDFFYYLSREEKKERYHALGSNQHVKVKSPWFGKAAKQAYDTCVEAINAEGKLLAHDKWRSIYGRAFPAKPRLIAESSYSGMESRSLWRNTEEFIEDRFSVDIRSSVEVDCVISQDGFRAGRLIDFIRSGTRLSHKKSLNFSIVKESLDDLESYHVYWKVLNIGPEAERRDNIRGQILPGNKAMTHKETTSFRGDHLVECYVVKNNVVVARQAIQVPIE